MIKINSVELNDGDGKKFKRVHGIIRAFRMYFFHIVESKTRREAKHNRLLQFQR